MRSKISLAIIFSIIILSMLITFVLAQDIRPINQQGLEKSYSPTEGSSYSSDGSNSNDRDEQIRPASQTSDRGTYSGQIRPANQKMTDKASDENDTNGEDSSNNQTNEENSTEYNPVVNDSTEPEIDVNETIPNNETEDNETVPVEETGLINLATVLSSTLSSASGYGGFILDTASNILQFEISYMNLSTPEIGASIDNNDGLIFALPFGMQKTGTWTYPEYYENDLINGNTIIKIKSLLFPDGELTGSITEI